MTSCSSVIKDTIRRIKVWAFGEKGKLEMHVHDVYSYETNEGNLPFLPSFGGDLSVRIPTGEQPILVFGQDEAIYRSSQLNKSCWTVDGESTL